MARTSDPFMLCMAVAHSWPHRPFFLWAAMRRSGCSARRSAISPCSFSTMACSRGFLRPAWSVSARHGVGQNGHTTKEGEG